MLSETARPSVRHSLLICLHCTSPHPSNPNPIHFHFIFISDYLSWQQIVYLKLNFFEVILWEISYDEHSDQYHASYMDAKRLEKDLVQYFFILVSVSWSISPFPTPFDHFHFPLFPKLIWWALLRSRHSAWGLDPFIHFLGKHCRLHKPTLATS